MRNNRLESESWKWNFDGSGDVHLVWNQTGFIYADHIHEDFNLDFIQSGLLEYRIAGRSYLAEANSAAWIHPHEVHSAKVLNHDKPGIASLFLPVHFVEKVMPGLKTSGLPKILNRSKLSFFMPAIYDAAKKSSNLMELEVHLIEMLGYLFSTFSPTCTALDDKGQRKAVKVVQNFLQEKFNENVRLNELADLVHLSKPYLVQIFRETVGLPPYSYLTQIRLEKARKLLVEGMHPAEVAVKVGFSDQSHLIRFFKRSTGVTPVKFLKEQ